MRRDNRLNRYMIIGLMLLAGHSLTTHAQDRVPTTLHPEGNMKSSKLLKEYKTTPDTIAARASLPKNFKHTATNRIVDNARALRSVAEQLHRLRTGVSDDTLRIIHIGDSHVRGRIFPRTVGERLNETFNDLISYKDMGVNGATCLTFTHPDRIEAIVERNPALLILSFGTNESHNRRYNAVVHYHQMDELVRLLRARLPDVPILLTTPPGSYESFRRRNRRRTYSINPRTATAANTINRYAHDRELAVWDMYNIVGGKESACVNWWGSGLMRPDHVHYHPAGYVLQGELLYEAFINMYNDYVSR